MAASTKCVVHAPQTVPCGLYGTCLEVLNETFCRCDEGFTQFGDFSTRIDNPCDLYVTAIRILWTGPIIFGLFGVWMSIWGIRSRLKSGKLPWSAWRLWSVPCFVLFYSCVMMAVSVGKIVDPIVWAVGLSVPTTILHGVGILGVATALIIGLAGISRTAYLDSVRTLAPDDRIRMKKKMQRIEIAIVIFWCLVVCCAFVPCAILVDPNAVAWAFSVQACSLGVAVFILGIFVTPRELGIILARVEESITTNKTSQLPSNDKLQRVARKLRVGKRMTRLASISATIVFFTFGLWPYLSVKVPYCLPILYALAMGAGSALIWVTTTTDTLVGFRRPSMALKRLSLAFSPTQRKSTEGRTGRSSVGGESSALTALAASPALNL